MSTPPMNLRVDGVKITVCPWCGNLPKEILTTEGKLRCGICRNVLEILLGDGGIQLIKPEAS